MKPRNQAYRKLAYFFENEIPIHFCLVKGGWKNGLIIDLSDDNETMVLKEFVEGPLPFLLEEIDVDTIKAYKERGEGSGTRTDIS